MSPNGFPSASSVSGEYPKDKVWGLVVMGLSTLGVCLGGAIVLIAGAFGLFATAFAASSGSPSETAGLTGLLGLASGFIALMGVALILSAALQIVGGAGIMKGRRWGFVLTGALALFSMFLGLASLPHGVVHLAINGVILYYCFTRLSGKEGPMPA